MSPRMSAGFARGATVIFDTDVLIWALKGKPSAASALDAADRLRISVVTYMELIQGARDAAELRLIRRFVADLGFEVVPLSENIGHRAAIYMEEYTLKSALSMADALIAATTVEHADMLCTANRKHYRAIADLQIKTYRP